ncbi:hypothetical protein [Bacillus sp. FJAT-45350]|uniref:hypothetical protein n=1 Tax=Bacillus sp. FJAT-45350 TaxID=2011014 RepID=UPI000BB7F3B2|nr:hypothetical protein [Bacillus sp. FJAT-45350]
MKKIILSLTAATFIAGSLVGCGTGGVEGQNMNMQRQDAPTHLDRGVTPGAHDPMMNRPGTTPGVFDPTLRGTPGVHDPGLGRPGIEGQMGQRNVDGHRGLMRGTHEGPIEQRNNVLSPAGERNRVPDQTPEAGMR